MTLLRVFVTGGTGLVGRHLISCLLEEGASVTALSRRPEAARAELAGVDWRGGDLDRPGSLQGALPPVDVVLHAGGDMPADEAACLRVNRDATRVLLDEARRVGARAFVHVSSVAVYGDRELRAVREDAERQGESAYARSKREAEDAVLAAASSGLRTVVVRPCPILGPGAGHFAAGVRALVGQPEVPLPDGGVRRVDLVAAEDVARALVAAATNDDASGAFHLAAGDALTLAEILSEAAAVAGVRPRFASLTLEAALAANHDALAAGLPPAVPWGLLAYAAFERTYDCGRARALLGFAPESAREALRRAVAAAG